MTTDRLQAITFGQGTVGQECVICLANNYNGTLVHRPGCDEVWAYVQAVRDGRGFSRPTRERVVVVGDEMGKGPGGQSGGYGSGQGYPNG